MDFQNVESLIGKIDCEDVKTKFSGLLDRARKVACDADAEEKKNLIEEIHSTLEAESTKCSEMIKNIQEIEHEVRNLQMLDCGGG
jgi:hypothetical protein